MSDESEAWVEYDYTPCPMEYEKCTGCGNDLVLGHYCALILEMTQLRGMIWWLATELSADSAGKDGDPDTWVTLAEKYWQQGLRSEMRFISCEAP